jgi:hypothetical protein
MERKIDLTMRRGRMEDDRQDREFLAYWRSRPIEERLVEMERLRQIMHGSDYATALRLSRTDLRLQRRRG